MSTTREMMLIEAIKQLDNDELIQYLQEEIEMKGRRPNVKTYNNDSNDNSDEETMKSIIMQKEKTRDCTSLHLALALQKSNQVIMKLIDMGGKELVMEKNNHQMTALHYVCYNSGSKSFTMRRSRRRRSSNDNDKNNHNISTMDVLTKMLDIGGKDLVMEKNNHQWTALHYACYSNASIEIISKLIEIGGQDLVKATSFRNCTALHFILFNPDGYDRRRGEHSDESSNDSSNKDLVVAEMLKQSILAQIGGRFGFGGLFQYLPTCDQDQIYDRWDDFTPSLERAIKSLEEEQRQKQPPILHAAITARAPKCIIKDIINRFDCVLTKDSQNNLLPIEVAIQHKFEWSKGMKEVVEATALRQKRLPIHVAARYGLQWDNHMEELIGQSIDIVVYGHDDLTGLHLFMLAAAGDGSDLNAIFRMLTLNPDLLESLISKSKRRKKVG